MSRLGVIGWPVGHSRSPAMQQAALRACGLRDWTYQLLPVPPELAAETITALPGSGFTGINVTIPHKEVAMAVSTAATDRARAIGAANTLTFDGREIEADNTDAPGLIEALPFSAAGKQALVLGAGGSARAAAWGLHEAGASRVMVWNRTRARAVELAADLGVEAVEHPPPADLLVNCTSVGLTKGDDPFKELPFAPDELCGYACLVDLVYGSGPTALMQAARKRGLMWVDGLEVLVRQGALSFERWTGMQAPLDVMREAARAPG